MTRRMSTPCWGIAHVRTPRADSGSKTVLETIFSGIKVEKVNTLRTLGKIKRQGRTSGRTPEIKKAYVTLKEDSKPIEFFEGMAD